MNGRYIVIGVGVLLAALGVFFSVYENKSIPDYKWQKSLSFEDDQPLGYKGFYELLQAKFGEGQIEYELKLDPASWNGMDSFGVIILDDEVALSSQIVQDITEAGGSLLIVSEDLNMDNVVEDEYSLETLGTYSKVTFGMLDFHWLEKDSIVIGRDSFYVASKEFKPLELNDFNFISDPYNSCETLVMGEEFDPICVKQDRTLGSFIWHANPIMFQNFALKQGCYIPHFDHVIGQLKGNMIFVGNGIMGAPSKKWNSPLEYILQHDALMRAYWLCIIMIVLYYFFTGVRRQKAVPIIMPIRNTSLEYADTLTELYLSQNQNRKLVLRMHRNFINYVRSSYLLDAKDNDNIPRLARKSGIGEDVLRRIMTTFENAQNGHPFNDRQLFELDRQLESFYKKKE